MNNANYGNAARTIDAVTLCIRNKEPKTLGTILRHPNLNLTRGRDSELLLLGNKAFSAIVGEMLSPQYLNAVVLGSFFENVPADRLQNIKDQTLVNLMRASLDIVPHKVEERIGNHFGSDAQEKINDLVQTVRSETPDINKIRSIVSVPPVKRSVESFEISSSDRSSSSPSTVGSSAETRSSETTRLLSGQEVPSNSICSRAYNAIRECFGLGRND